ncbi:hypothetical protein [Rhizobium sp. LCM 4573]|uniref:hypothetical protein n=1 Tax=Rhizobium sp. LCM 4573 TaxID=1848291 RepID=UPI0008D9FBEB|nr:hypothetical protein [Rhizobium sp. LCM 4573]OHV75636.1 hypothetical protein LCM4573_15970 [Rhizobium sp. LCM 4573]
MDDFETLDLALFGLWAEQPRFGETVRMEDLRLADAVRGVLLETKSAEGMRSDGEELRRLLNEMTVEMRAQFSTFRKLRATAEALLDGGDEAAQKLARADVKAATDAMSLIVRTLEKVDALQRQLARDRELEAERQAEEGGYEDAVREVERLIEERARERFESWKCEGRADGGEPGGPGGDRPQPPDTG